MKGRERKGEKGRERKGEKGRGKGGGRFGQRYHESRRCKLSFDNCHSRQNIFRIVRLDNGNREGGGA
jgi:hypothetical protein